MVSQVVTLGASMSVTDDIKAQIDIVSYINQYVPLKKAGKYYKACCPFHSEKTPSFTVSADRQSWRCFGACAEGGDVFNFAMKYHGWEFKEALVELGKLAGVTVQEQSPEQKQQANRKEKLGGLLNEAADAFHRKLYDPNDAGAQAALAYARNKRGLSDATINAFGIGYAPPGWDNILNYLTELGYTQQEVIDAGLALTSERTQKTYDRFRNRLVVPIRDQRGRAVGFGGRILDPNDTPKYLNTPQTLVFDKSHLLFGLDLAKNAIRETETAVIVEGYMDVITAHQAGFTNVVAQMGTAMTEHQLGLIAPRWTKTIVLALDSDAAGQNATRRSLEVARETLAADYTGQINVAIKVLQIPNAKDPDDLIRETPDQWKALVANATPVADYVIETEIAALPDQPNIQQREEVARRLMPILAATENNLYQRENVQKLAMRLLIPERDLFRIADEEAQRQRQQAARRKAQPKRPPPPPTSPPPPSPPPTLDLDDDDSGPPPLNYDNIAPPADPPDLDEGPPPLDYGEAAPIASPPPAAAPPPSMPISQDAHLEAHMLHSLLNYAEGYYRVNGKLREAANQNEALLNGAMQPFGLADFTQPGMRALMALFLKALKQDELEVRDYVIDHADQHLVEELEMVFEDRLQAKFQAPTISAGDYRLVRAQSKRSGMQIDPRQDVVSQAIRLRCRRLNREREEYRLVQMSALQSGDQEQAEACADHLDQLARAVHMLEIEERQVSRLF